MANSGRARVSDLKLMQHGNSRRALDTSAPKATNAADSSSWRATAQLCHTLCVTAQLPLDMGGGEGKVSRRFHFSSRRLPRCRG